MEAMPGWVTGAFGFLIGVAAGFFVRRARLCTFGAFEDAIAGQDTRRLKVFGLAFAVAVLATQALVLFAGLDLAQVRYLPSQMPWLAIAVGGVLFGLGMALVGTCAFGSLIRLGSGDLRSVLTLLIFSATAYAMLRGALSPLRVDYAEAITLPMPGETRSDLASLAGAALGLDIRLALAALCAGALVLIFLGDPRLRRSRRHTEAGLVLGLGVAGGWLVTGVLADEFSLVASADSLTFVAPVARSVFGFMLTSGQVPDFGTGSVFGVVAGAFLAARQAGELRWEAFDDHHEMKRHMVGAALMGMGGVLAGGCTIGQGLTAGSMLALSWPIAVIGMAVGARIGIALLIEGSLRGLLARLGLFPAR